MINIFNRKELIVTYSMEKQAAVRDILNDNKIEYYIKVVNRKSSSPFSAGTRPYTGTLGENLNLEYEYIIYVNGKDYEKAYHLINGN